MLLKSTFWRSKKVIQVVQIVGKGGPGWRGGGGDWRGNLDKIQKNSNLFS